MASFVACPADHPQPEGEAKEVAPSLLAVAQQPAPGEV